MPIYNKMHLLPTPTYLKYIARQLYSITCDRRSTDMAAMMSTNPKTLDLNIFILSKPSDPPIQNYTCPHYTLFSR